MNIEWNDIRDSIPPEGQQVVFYYRGERIFSQLGLIPWCVWRKQMAARDLQPRWLFLGDAPKSLILFRFLPLVFAS